jgi:hypothetical protein
VRGASQIPPRVHERHPLGNADYANTDRETRRTARNDGRGSTSAMWNVGIRLAVVWFAAQRSPAS